MSRGTQLEIRPHALRHNARRAAELAGAADCFAMIKADGYGHGLQRVAQALRDQVDGFGVAVMEEAVALREIDIAAPLMLLEGCFDAGEWRLAEQLQLEVVIHCTAQLDTLDQSAIKGPLAVWLKVDTGMHRIGIPCAHAAAIIESLLSKKNIRLVGLMTHFACADITDNVMSVSQHEKIRILAEQFQLPYSAANSAALFRYPQSHAARVRPGIMLYGSSPFVNQTAAQLQLAVTQKLSAKIIAINTVPRGDTVGYGGQWTASRDSRIATVAIGYGDGYPRHAENGAPVSVNGVRTQTVGRVSMDMITIDVTDVADAEMNDEVELWGDTVGVDEVAAFCGTISYELFCRVTARPHRVIVDGEA